MNPQRQSGRVSSLISVLKFLKAYLQTIRKIILFCKMWLYVRIIFDCAFLWMLLWRKHSYCKTCHICCRQMQVQVCVHLIVLNGTIIKLVCKLRHKWKIISINRNANRMKNHLKMIIILSEHSSVTLKIIYDEIQTCHITDLNTKQIYKSHLCFSITSPLFTGYYFTCLK